MTTGIYQRLVALVLVVGFAVAAGGVSHASLYQATPETSQSSQPCHANWRINSIALSPDGQYLLASWNLGTARMWNLKTGAVLHTFLVAQDSIVDRVVFSPDGKYVLTSIENGLATLWDTQTGAKVRTFGTIRLPPSFGPLAAFLPDAKHILT